LTLNADSIPSAIACHSPERASLKRTTPPATGPRSVLSVPLGRKYVQGKATGPRPTCSVSATMAHRREEIPPSAPGRKNRA
jgi:hypothetical protein